MLVALQRCGNFVGLVRVFYMDSYILYALPGYNQFKASGSVHNSTVTLTASTLATGTYLSWGNHFYSGHFLQH